MFKKILFITIITISFFVVYFFLKGKINQKNNLEKENISTEQTYTSNIIENVEYHSKDNEGNEYILYAKEGEIDFNDSNVIFLKQVKSIIKPLDSNEILITSDFGKYNSNNFDAIFSKNVVITYLENIITAEYLDFSLNRNTMIISKNVIYENNNNILKSDIIELNIKTKDTKIFMLENKKQVNIKSKN